jgi:hypothetical protein
MTPASTASTKAQRNRRKKENAKKRKAEASQKEAPEANLLAEMGSMALYEKVLDSAREGNPRSSPAKTEVGEQRSEGSSSHHFISPILYISFRRQLLTLLTQLNMLVDCGRSRTLLEKASDSSQRNSSRKIRSYFRKPL